MNTRRSGWSQALAIVLLVAAGLVFWRWYAKAHWLHAGFGRFLGDALPIYANSWGRSLNRIPGAVARLMVAVVVSVVSLSVVMTAVTRRWRTWVCISLAVIAVLAINVSIARVPFGNESFVAPFARQGLEYFSDTGSVGDKPVRFIRMYPRLAFMLSHHAGTHPPGGVLFLWLGKQVFGGSLDASCWLAVIFTALGVVPTYVLARSIGGAATARRMLPLYLAAPNLVLFGATCMDGVFLTFAVTAMAAGFIAMRRWSVIRPIVAGALLWLAAFMTFAVLAVPLLMGCYAICIGIRRPRVGAMMIARAVFVGIVFILCQLIAERALGYDIFATVQSAMRRDLSGLGITGYDTVEIYWDLSLGNLLAFTFGSGLATAALFVLALVAIVSTAIRHRSPVSSRRARAFVPAVAIAVLMLACSTLFTMEVERVWLFLTPVVLIAATVAYRGRWVWLVAPALMLSQAVFIEWNFNTWW